MNVIEVCMLITPVAGAIGGVTGARPSPPTTVSALVIGAAVGIGIIAGMRLAARKLSHRFKLECPAWLAVLLAVFVIPMSLPVVAFFLSRLIVSAGLHL
jgi:predicted MFS family arabinose efflux permease